MKLRNFWQRFFKRSKGRPLTIEEGARLLGAEESEEVAGKPSFISMIFSGLRTSRFQFTPKPRKSK